MAAGPVVVPGSAAGMALCAQCVATLLPGDHLSRTAHTFHGRSLPEPGTPAGYAWLLERYGLRVPLPPRLAAVAMRHRPRATERWRLVSPRQAPDESLAGHLTFALEYEGVDLAVIAAMRDAIPDAENEAMVRRAPTGCRARRAWFLYEWATGRPLAVPDAPKVQSAPAVEPALQYAHEQGPRSVRHRLTDILPGTPEFAALTDEAVAMVERVSAEGTDAGRTTA